MMSEKNQLLLSFEFLVYETSTMGYAYVPADYDGLMIWRKLPYKIRVIPK